MLKEGWVKARWSVSSSGRRVRIYDLTAAGARHLHQEVSSFDRMLKGIKLVLSTVES
jgi:DNA-binding PadR family transcriptional regulator